MVEWYDNMETYIGPWKVALLPYDAIKPSHGYIGICPPGIGVHRYTEMSNALFEFIEGVIPLTEEDVKLWIKVQKQNKADGYQLLHKLFVLYMPGFNRTTMIQQPLYHACDNIAGYAAAILAHYRIKAKTGAFTDDKTKSLVFLQNIGHPNITNSLPIWIDRVTNYYGPGNFDNGSLPETLRIPALAMELSTLEKATALAMDPTHHGASSQ